MMRKRAIEARPSRPATRPANGRFGKLLRQLRLERCLSQAELGRRTGLGHSIISRYETGERLPRRRTLAAIADALGLEPPDRVTLFAAAGYVYGMEEDEYAMD